MSHREVRGGTNYSIDGASSRLGEDIVSFAGDHIVRRLDAEVVLFTGAESQSDGHPEEIWAAVAGRNQRFNVWSECITPGSGGAILSSCSPAFLPIWRSIAMSASWFLLSAASAKEILARNWNITESPVQLSEMLSVADWILGANDWNLELYVQEGKPAPTFLAEALQDIDQQYLRWKACADVVSLSLEDDLVVVRLVGG